MALPGIRNEKVTAFLLFVLSFLVFMFFLASSLNVSDYINFAFLITQATKTGNYLLPVQAFGPYGKLTMPNLIISRYILFVLLTYPASVLLSFFGLSLETSLNALSALFAALSVAMMYRIARMYFDKRRSLAASILYMLIPYVFFNATNATICSLVFLFSTLWLYYLLKGIRTGREKYGLMSTVFFVLGTFSYMIMLFTGLGHLYGILRMKSKGKLRVRLTRQEFVWLLKNFAIVCVLAPLVFYFTFINRSYPLGNVMNLKLWLLSVPFLLWEMANTMSPLLFLFFIASLLLILVKILRKKAEPLEIICLLTFVGLFVTIFPFFHYIFVESVSPIFIFVPLLFVKAFEKKKYFWALLIVVLAFCVLKAAPVVFQLHFYEQPYKLYALWLQSAVPNSTVLGGNECAAIQYYSDLNFVCRSVNLKTYNATKNTYVSQVYFSDANALEFYYMANITKIPNVDFSSIAEQLAKPNVIDTGMLTPYASYPYPSQIRTMTDAYQWFYSFCPNPVLSAFTNTCFMQQPYEIYSIKG